MGLKDGIGEIELMVSIRRRLGARLAYLGVLRTAEVYAAAYKAIGVPVYSSAVFNFIPRRALQFYQAVASDDAATQARLLDEFFLPYLEIRNRRPGYAVSIVKAGARLVGRDAGPCGRRSSTCCLRRSSSSTRSSASSGRSSRL